MATSRKTEIIDTLDETDRQIVAILKRDGRASNQAIAQGLDLSPAAVGARVRRLEREKMLRVVLVADFDVIGADVLLAIGIKVNGRSARAVTRDVAALPQVFSCTLMAGTYNVEALVALADATALGAFVEQDLAAIKGIGEVSVEMALDIVKYEFDVVPFTSR